MNPKPPLKLSEVRAFIKKHDRKDLEFITENEKKMALRERLIKIKNYILEKDELPKYMY